MYGSSYPCINEVDGTVKILHIGILVIIFFLKYGCARQMKYVCLKFLSVLFVLKRRGHRAGRELKGERNKSGGGC